MMELDLRQENESLRTRNTELVEALGAAERPAVSLRNAESRLSRLSESGLIGIVIGDNRGSVTEANDAILDMLGYSRDEIVSGRVLWEDLTPPEWRDGDARAISQLATSGVGQLHEKEYIRNDGTRVAVLVGSALLDGETTTSISFVLDITERKLAQAEIVRLREDRAADAKFRGLLETAPDAVVVIGDGGAIVLVNHQFETLFGYARGDIVGCPIEVLIPPDDRDAAQLSKLAYFRPTGLRPGGERLEIDARRKDGTEFPIEVSLSWADTPGGPLVSCAIRDITDRRRTEEQRSRLVAIVDASRDAIIGKTVDGMITSWNRGAELTFGYTANEAVGRSISILVPVERASEREAILAVAAKGIVQYLDTVRRTKAGRLLEVSATISPVLDAAGRVDAISDVLRDVTEKKRDERALIHARDDAVTANRELEAFSYSVAHDLRSPLRGISAFAELLLDASHDQLDPESQDWLRRIVASAARMATLIDALLSLSRVTRNDLISEVVDLSALVGAAGARLAAAEVGHPTELVVEPGLWAIMDPRLALVLVENLLGNAWKFTRNAANPRIEFGVTQRHGARTFFVRDNGAGFDMKYFEKLFAPFQRLHAEKEFSGTGIGLATVERIVRRHGGEISAEGVVGRGATFYFTLPPRGDGALS
jgi:PAS domain S-box-containing protein